ncbi:hypothetical protein HGRIS_000408 [Hohenbuehelia grisea]|uniref:Glucose-methanol-choline oxidoreductase C-terminal domain-containing protein n=1 Tax=Hohenbuehelia grisea TaxID=104357 RepID=A0ABR3JSU8_9AGAR
MSPRGAKEGAVDPDLRLKGVEGVRVVDASILLQFHDTRRVNMNSSLRSVNALCSPGFLLRIPKHRPM